MAIVRFANRKNSVEETTKNSIGYIIKYITDREKTSDELIGGVGVTEKNAERRMLGIKKFYGKEGGRQYVQIVVSFRGQRDPDIALIIAKNIAHILDEYQVLYAVHTNTENAHIHFALNTVAPRSGKKFSQSRAGMEEFKEHVLYIIEKVCERRNAETEQYAVDFETDFEDYDFEHDTDEDEIGSEECEYEAFLKEFMDMKDFIEPMEFYRTREAAENGEQSQRIVDGMYFYPSDTNMWD